MSKTRILVGEDNEDMQEFYQIAAGAYPDISLTICARGDDFLKMATAEYSSIDVIFGDNSMPVINGLDVLRKFREYERHHGYQSKPFVVVSAGSSKKDAMDAGATGYFQKPISLDELAIILDKLRQQTTPISSGSKPATHHLRS